MQDVYPFFPMVSLISKLAPSFLAMLRKIRDSHDSYTAGKHTCLESFRRFYHRMSELTESICTV